MAIDHAEHPKQPVTSLKQGRIAGGIDDPDLSTTWSPHGRGSCRVPGAARIFARIADDMRLMAAPVPAAHPDGFAARLDKLLAAMPAVKDDLLDPPPRR
jgi:hypothetical protein